jgi:two-component system response regulator AlgR
VIRVLVVDDEAPARDRLVQLVEDIGDFTVVGTAGDGREALELVESCNPDIVLMDIRMPRMDGIEAAGHLSQLEQPPAVIFVTAFDDYALKAFETAAVGYILKPVRRARLEEGLARAARPTRAQLASINPEDRQRRHISARSGDHLHLIPVQDVLYFRAGQKYVSVRHGGGSHLIDESLKELEGEFAEEFVRIHRNALVALRHIQAIEKGDGGQLQVRLRDCEETLPVSRRHSAGLRRKVQSA